ncbi:MAG: hypothetical protein EOM11_06295, partial [Erysipelotrichia bacterium]|nr:hypothetical protein [Erysipelotrichia bacterium]
MEKKKVLTLLLGSPRIGGNTEKMADAFVLGKNNDLAGVMIADYYLVRKRKLDLGGLYKVDGPYTFSAGFNWAGIVAFALGVLPNIPGFLVQVEILSP